MANPKNCWRPINSFSILRLEFIAALRRCHWVPLDFLSFRHRFVERDSMFCDVSICKQSNRWLLFFTAKCTAINLDDVTFLTPHNFHCGAAQRPKLIIEAIRCIHWTQWVLPARTMSHTLKSQTRLRLRYSRSWWKLEIWWRRCISLKFSLVFKITLNWREIIELQRHEAVLGSHDLLRELTIGQIFGLSWEISENSFTSMSTNQ